MNRLITYTSYSVGDILKVQVFNIITTGKVIAIKVEHVECGSSTKYIVQFGNKIVDTVSPSEADLVAAQSLPLGEIK